MSEESLIAHPPALCARVWSGPIAEVVLAVAACACGGRDPGNGTPCGGPGRLLPLEVGASWTYWITEPAGTSLKTSTVEAREDVGGSKAGTVALRVRTEKPDGITVSWQEVLENAVIRHREQTFDLASTLIADEFYDPHKLRVDESCAHLADGAVWVERYTERTFDAVSRTTSTGSRSEQWSVVASRESVTVPGGTFDCLHVRRLTVSGTSGKEKRYWFARGVGKVKELSDRRTEELTAWSLP